MEDLAHCVADSHYGGGMHKGFRCRNEPKKLKGKRKKLCWPLMETLLIFSLNKRDTHLATLVQRSMWRVRQPVSSEPPFVLKTPRANT